MGRPGSRPGRHEVRAGIFRREGRLYPQFVCLRLCSCHSFRVLCRGTKCARTATASNHRQMEVKVVYTNVHENRGRHFAEACAEQFQTVASNWAIEDKTTIIGTDSARNMIATARLIPQILQRSITVSLADSGFVNALSSVAKLSATSNTLTEEKYIAVYWKI